MVVAVLGLQLTLTAPASAQSGCEAPNPERPGSGMVGAIDPPAGNGEDGSAYLDYSYAGMVWHVYDCDSGALSLGSPESTIDTWAGNQLFNIAKNIVGATNSLHYTVLEGGLLNPIYNAVSQGAETVYDNIYTQLFGLAALLLAILLFRNIWRGDLSTVSKRALFALGGVWLAASSMALLRYYDEIDNAIVQTTTNIQAGFVDKAEERVVRHVLPTDLHNEVVYKNWLRGEFGSPDSPQAEEYGRDLLDAQAFTWEEMRNGDDADEELIEEKKASYQAIANQLGPATGYFTGEDGSRTGVGFLALIQSLCYALFQLFAKAAVLLAQILVRLFTLTAPLIGLIAILHHDILRRVGRVVGTVAFNLLVLSVLAGVQALLLRAIFSAGSALSMLTQMVVAGLITVLLFMVGKPGKRLWQMVEMSVGMVGAAVPSPAGDCSRGSAGTPTNPVRRTSSGRRSPRRTPPKAVPPPAVRVGCSRVGVIVRKPPCWPRPSGSTPERARGRIPRRCGRLRRERRYPREGTTTPVCSPGTPRAGRRVTTWATAVR